MGNILSHKTSCLNLVPDWRGVLYVQIRPIGPTDLNLGVCEL